ncbi:MAG: leucine-rich repeat domain-containing protein [Bacteroidetes bacterium]|nr:leucine-rich repeat domain-containing protein [Bacteroidota bacterium]
MKTLLIAGLMILAATKISAQPDATFGTITEALNYTGDKSAVKKLIITDSIAGSDYSDGSEWRLFRTLDEVFENIEEIELHTSQDIPDNQRFSDSYGCGLFSEFYFEWDENEKPIMYSSDWLKSFSAPNIKKIGNGAFQNCKNLSSINFLNVEIIGVGVFCWCESLIEINFPNVKNIGNGIFHRAENLNSVNLPNLKGADWGVFIGCNNLRHINFGEHFTEPTTINFGWAVFGDSINITSGLYDAPVRTENIELTLGTFVLPIPDTTFNTWQGTNDYFNSYDYKWKKINFLGIKENEKDDDNIFCIGNNIYMLQNVEQAELFDLLGRKIASFKDEQIIDLNNYNLSIGFYFIKIIDNNKNIKTYKIINY